MVKVDASRRHARSARQPATESRDRADRAAWRCRQHRDRARPSAGRAREPVASPARRFNVAGRDLLSVVQEAQARVSAQVKLPPGYRVEWGGQFEHYLDARSRLSVVVPLAIALILFLLWLALGALPPALVILANVPFAAVGGVLALWLRGMPFSISAGVGFIALFGVAVLNGLVLVSVVIAWKPAVCRRARRSCRRRGLACGRC